MDLREYEEIMSRPIIVDLTTSDSSGNLVRKFYLVKDTKEFEEDAYTSPKPQWTPGLPEDLQGSFVDSMTILPSIENIKTAVAAYGREITEKEFRRAEKQLGVERLQGNEMYALYRGRLKSK